MVHIAHSYPGWTKTFTQLCWAGWDRNPGDKKWPKEVLFLPRGLRISSLLKDTRKLNSTGKGDLGYRKAWVQEVSLSPRPETLISYSETPGDRVALARGILPKKHSLFPGFQAFLPLPIGTSLAKISLWQHQEGPTGKLSSSRKLSKIKPAPWRLQKLNCLCNHKVQKVAWVLNLKW